MTTGNLREVLLSKKIQFSLLSKNHHEFLLYLIVIFVFWRLLVETHGHGDENLPLGELLDDVQYQCLVDEDQC